MIESTPDRILTTSLRLFNRYGVDRVPVYKIAAELGISPGNLTYHFPRKQDILYRLIANLENEASGVLASLRNPSANQLAGYLVGVFRLMWRYHFFFELLTHLTATDPKIAESHNRIRTNAQNASIKRIEDALASGDILPVVLPSTPKILAENMWAVWVNRLGLTRAADEIDDSGDTVVYDCCLHHLSLIQPYASGKYIVTLQKAVETELKINASSTLVDS